ncbi:MAG: hypothetical protein WC480_04760 [Patescibacteria group bacterium]
MPTPEQNVHGLTEKELKISLWLVTNKILLLKLLKVFLVILNIVIWGYVVYNLVDFYLISWTKDEALRRELTISYIDYNGLRQLNRPRDLVISSVDSFDLGNDRYDFMARVTNPNPNWDVVSIKYVFNFAGREEDKDKETFILPGDEKYLVDLGVYSQRAPANLSLKIEEVRWQRVHQYQELKDQVLNFTIFDVRFVPPKELPGGRVPVAQTQFSVKNRSAYNFWEVGYYIILWRGPKIVGVNYVLINEDFSSQTVKNLEVNWYQRLSSVDKVEVIPEINVLDPDAYRQERAGVGEVQ